MAIQADNAIAAAASDDRGTEYEEFQPVTNNVTSPSSSATGVSGASPDKRRWNPLSKLSSYTYQLSLHMLTGDGYNAFVKNGRKDVAALTNATGEPAAYLLMQSGGINSKNSTRPDGFGFDYYIDDLKIKSMMSPNETGAASFNQELSFTITEPYGFSFISNLKRTADQLKKGSNTPNIQDLKNASRQFFILGITFLGYDANGEIVPSGDSFKKYYDIFLTKIAFKLDGKSTVYSISASPVHSMIGAGTKRGVIERGAELRGRTINDFLNGSEGLIAKLNKDQDAHVKRGGFRNNYSIIFRGEGVDKIANASLVSTADLNKAKWPTGKPKNVNDINPGLEDVPDANRRRVVFKGATPVVQAITQLISQSEYLENALKVVYTAADETKTKPNPGRNANELKWFNVSFEAICTDWDPLLSDFAFDITYIIQPYSTPFTMAASAGKTTPYYGPVKRYEYYYTGLNSEIIRYEQVLNNAFYTVTLQADGSPESQGGGADVPQAIKQAGGSKLGENNNGLQAQNEYVTSLVDPGNFSRIKLEILGDPDWLSQDGKNNTTTSLSPFYGPDGFSIDPRSGQVFIEINFEEAVDYNNRTGTLDTNNSILFWDYPEDIRKKLHGISYAVFNVTSFFRQGKFTQELTGTINTFGGSSKISKQNQRQDSGADPVFEAPSMASNVGVDPPFEASSMASSGLKTAPRTAPWDSPAAQLARETIRRGPYGGLLQARTKVDDDASAGGLARGSTLTESGRGSI